MRTRLGPTLPQRACRGARFSGLPLGLAAAALLAGAGAAQAAGGCEGLSVSVVPSAGQPEWTLEVPFDEGYATLAGPGGARQELVVNETCSPRRVAFDLAPRPGAPGGHCTLVLEGSEATGGCVIAGAEDRPVTGLVRRAGSPEESRGDAAAEDGPHAGSVPSTPAP